MTENTPINNTQRIQVVDALRGFAIIAIMLVHFWSTSSIIPIRFLLLRQWPPSMKR